MAAHNVVILENIKLKRIKEGILTKQTSRATVSHPHISEGGLDLSVEPTVGASLTQKVNTDGDNPPTPNTSHTEMKETDTRQLITASHCALKRNTEPESSESKNRKDGKKVKIFTKYKGPEWHKVCNNIVTKPIISTNLPKAFQDFPIFGKPKNKADLPSFQDRACREFVGVTDDEYDQLQELCSPELLLTGREMEMSSSRPTLGQLSAAMALREEENGIVSIPENPKLLTLKKLKTRIKDDLGHVVSRKLKYRGVRLLPLQNQDRAQELDDKPLDLEPGKDIVYRVRVYRPFPFSAPGLKTSSKTSEEGNHIRGRHSVFNCDVVVVGRQRLSELRDRIVCRNDLDLRLDMSEHPDLPPPTTAKESFPSNFMFINNVFYTDSRAHCRDLTRGVRQFARARRLGRFPVRDMCQVYVHQLQLRLAYPEVYVHQGNCEHIFQFSEIRLLNSWDPLHLRQYPCHTAVSQYQTLYCNNCAEFTARWIVTASKRVPFDPAFFCETCFYSYMYKDGKKVENFKAYLYKGNEINILRPNLDLDHDLNGSGSANVHNQVRITF